MEPEETAVTIPYERVCDMMSESRNNGHKSIAISSRQRGCYIRTMFSRGQLPKKNLVINLEDLGAEIK
jgi:hypothetical protein